LAFGPALSWDARSRGPVGRLYRKLLRRLLRPYTLRQRELETLLANGLEDLEASRDRLDTAVRQLEERLRELERDVDEADPERARVLPADRLGRHRGRADGEVHLTRVAARDQRDRVAVR